MSYAIVGFGKIGQALARAFARRNMEVAIASRRTPEELPPQARAIGTTVVAKSLREALEADKIILAVPFGEYREARRPAELEKQDGHRRDERVSSRGGIGRPPILRLRCEVVHWR